MILGPGVGISIFKERILNPTSPTEDLRVRGKDKFKNAPLQIILAFTEEGMIGLINKWGP